MIFEVPSGQELIRLPLQRPVRSTAFTEDGERIAIVDDSSINIEPWRWRLRDVPKKPTRNKNSAQKA